MQLWSALRPTGIGLALRSEELSEELSHRVRSAESLSTSLRISSTLPTLRHGVEGKRLLWSEEVPLQPAIVPTLEGRSMPTTGLRRHPGITGEASLHAVILRETTIGELAPGAAHRI